MPPGEGHCELCQTHFLFFPPITHASRNHGAHSNCHRIHLKCVIDQPTFRILCLNHLALGLLGLSVLHAVGQDTLVSEIILPSKCSVSLENWWVYFKLYKNPLLVFWQKFLWIRDLLDLKVKEMLISLLSEPFYSLAWIRKPLMQPLFSLYWNWESHANTY